MADINQKSYNFLKKGKNLLKFHSFSDRIEKVDLAISLKEKTFTLPKGQTHFNATLGHFYEIDLSLPFSQLRKSLLPFCHSLTALLLNQNQILDILLAALKDKNNAICYPAIFALLSAMAQDLRNDFEGFGEAMDVLTGLVESKNPERLEQIFNTCGYFFRFLGKSLVNQFESILTKHFLPLLKSPKAHIRDFSGECAAYLARKLPHSQLPLLAKTVLSKSAVSPKDQIYASEGLAAFAFSFVSGKSGKLNKMAKPFLIEIFRFLAEKAANLRFQPENREFADFLFAADVVAIFLRRFAKFSLRKKPFGVHSKLGNELIESDFEVKTMSTVAALLADKIVYFSEEKTRGSLFGAVTFVKLLSALMSVKGGIFAIFDSQLITLITTKLAEIIPETETDGFRCKGEESKFLTESIMSFYKVLFWLKLSDYNLAKTLRRLFIKIAKSAIFSFGVVFDFFVCANSNPVFESSEIHSELLSKFCGEFLNSSPQDRLQSLSQILKLARKIKTAPANSTTEDSLRTKRLISHFWGFFEHFAEFLNEKESFSAFLDDFEAHSELLTEAQILAELSSFLFAQFDSIEIEKLNEICSKITLFEQKLALQRPAKFSQQNAKTYQTSLQNLSKMAEISKIRRSLSRRDLANVHIAPHGQPKAVFALLSEDSPRKRLEGLRFLENSRRSDSPVWGRFLANATAVFSAPLNFENERNASKSLEAVLNDALNEEVSCDFLAAVLHFLIGVLKIKYQNIWKPAKRALVALSKNLPAKFRKEFASFFEAALFAELTAQLSAAVLSERPNDSVRFTVSGLYDELFLREKESVANAEMVFESVCGVLTELPALAFQMNAKIAALFIDYCDGVLDSQSSHLRCLKTATAHRESSRLSLFLRLFSSWKKLQTVHRQKDLKTLFYGLLAFDVAEIQRLSLRCLFLWAEESHLEAHRRALSNLLDMKKIKEELIAFKLSSVAKEERRRLLPVIFRLFLPRIIDSEKKKSFKSALKTAIFIFLADLNTSEAVSLLRLIFARLGIDDAEKRKLRLSCDQIFSQSFALLTALKWFFKFFKPVAALLFEGFLETILAVFSKCVSVQIGGDCGEKHSCLFLQGNARKTSSHAKKIADLCTARVFELSKLKYSANIAHYLSEAVRFAAARKNWNEFKKKSLLDILRVLSQDQRSVKLILEDANVFGFLLSLFGANAPAAVFKKVAQIFCDLTAVDQKAVDWSILVKNLPNLLNSIKTRIANDQSITPNDTLPLVSNLLLFCASKDHFQKASDILIDFLGHKKIASNWERFQPVLDANLRVFEALKSRDLALRLWDCLSPQLRDESDPSKLAKVSEILCILAKKLGCDITGKAIKALNSFTKDRVDFEVDFDQRAKAYHSLKEKLPELDEFQLTPLCALFLRDAISVDFGLRGLATSAMTGLLAARSSGLSGDVSGGFLPFVRRKVFPSVLAGLSVNSSLDAKISVLRILRAIVIYYKSFSEDLVVLHNEDEEKDFFENFFHIQISKRLKALLFLQKVLSDREGSVAFSGETVDGILVPLVVYTALESKNKNDNLRAEAIATLGKLSAQLKWPKLLKWLGFFLKNLKERPDLERTFVKCICRMIDNYPSGEQNAFSQKIEQIAFWGEKLEDVPQTNKKDFCRDLVKQLVLKIPQKDAEKSQEIERKRTKIKSLIAQLKSLLRDRKNKELVRMGVSIAVVKLLGLLDQKTLRKEFYSLLLEICGALKSRQQKVRNEARYALNGILRIVGPGYFLYILGVLRKTLLKGYQKQVLAHTVHSMLVSLDTSGNWAGWRNSPAALKQLSKVLFDDIFGQASEDREVEKIRISLKEANCEKSYDSFFVLAKRADFGCCAALVAVAAVERFFRQTKVDRKRTNKLERLLLKVAEGMVENRATSAEEVLLYVRETLETVFSAAEDAVRKEKKSAAVPIMSQKGLDNERSRSRERYSVFREESAVLDSRKSFGKEKNAVLIRMSLTILSKLIQKRGKDIIGQKPLIRKLTPFLEKIQTANFVDADTQAVVLKVFKAIFSAFKSDLPFKLASRLSSGCFENLSRFENRQELSTASYSLLATLIKTYKSIKLQKEHSALILSFIKEHLGSPSKQHTALTFLKAILIQKTHLSALKGIMEDIKALAVQSTILSVQKQCSKCLVKYLCHSQLPDTLLRNHMKFLLSNLDYAAKSGRLTAQRVVAALAKHFPQKVFLPYCDFIFFPVLAAFGNEGDATCQLILSEAIRKIFGRLNPEKFEKYADFVFGWTKSDSESVQTLSVKVFALIFALPEMRSSAKSAFVEFVVSVVEREAESCGEEEGSLGAANGDFGSLREKWKKVYISLVCLKRLIKAKELETLRLKTLIASLVLLTTHRHFWVRSESIAAIKEILFLLERADFEGECARSIKSAPLKIIAAMDCRFLDSAFGAECNDCLVEILSFGELASEMASEIYSAYCKAARKSTLAFKQSLLDFTRKILEKLKTSSKAIAEPAIETVLGFLQRKSWKMSDLAKPFETFQKECELLLDLVKTSLGNEEYIETYNKVAMKRAKSKEKRRKKRVVSKVSKPAVTAAKRIKENRRKRSLKKRRLEGPAKKRRRHNK